MMKILLVTTHLNFGGVARYVVSLAEALTKRGVAVIVASSGGDLEAECSRVAEHIRLRIRTKCEYGPAVAAAIPALAGIVKDRKVDLIHANTRVTQVASCMAALMTRRPFVSTCHGFFRPGLARRLFGCWGKRVIAISKPVMEHLIRDLSVDKERITLVYNGVDCDRFSRDVSPQSVAALKGKLGLGNGPVIGAIGRFSPVKGHQYFIEAFRTVRQTVQGAQGMIVGAGPEQGLLERLIQEHALEGSFHLVSPTPDTAAYLSLFDVFVFPSVKEGLGLSLIEAMASGKACVASDVGGIRDVILDGQNGLLAAPKDPRSLARAIVTMLGDTALKKRLGQNAAQTARRSFSLDEMAERTIALYREVLAAG